MSDLNQCTFTGRLADAAEVREVGGKTKGRYRIAVNGYKKDAEPLWLTCDHWNIGGVSQFLAKGNRICVSGSLKQEKWKGKDGVEKTAMVLNVRDLVLLDGQRKSDDRPKWEADDAPF